MIVCISNMLTKRHVRNINKGKYDTDNEAMENDENDGENLFCTLLRKYISSSNELLGWRSVKLFVNRIILRARSASDMPSYI